MDLRSGIRQPDKGSCLPHIASVESQDIQDNTDTYRADFHKPQLLSASNRSIQKLLHPASPFRSKDLEGQHSDRYKQEHIRQRKILHPLQPCAVLGLCLYTPHSREVLCRLLNIPL